MFLLKYQAMISFKDFYQKNFNQDIEVAPGVSYNINDVMTENRRFFHSRFKTEKTTSGMKKIFYNIGYIFYDTHYRHTDIDFKDLELEATNDDGLLTAPIIRKVLQSYVSKPNKNGEKPDRIINQVRESMLQDGVVYVKLVDDVPYIVDPFNIIEPAHQDKLGTLAEKITLSPAKVEEMYLDEIKKDNKEEFKNVVERAKEEGGDLTVYEFWDYDTKKCQVWLAKDNYDYNFKDYTQWDDAFMKLTEFESTVKDQYGNITFPYAKEHNVHVRGRRIGFSVFEIVKGILYNYNEIMNMNREKSLLDLRGLFKFTKGLNNRAIPQSFMEKLGLGGFLELENGEDIERLPYQYVAGEVMAIADNLFNTGRKLTGTASMDVGDKLPSRVPATAIVDSRKNAQTAYDVTVENMSILLTDLLERMWVPTILRKLTKEKAIAITGSLMEINKLDRVVITQEVYKELHKVKDEYGFYGVIVDGLPVQVYTDEDIDRIIEERLNKMEGNTRFVNVKRALIKSLEYSIKMVVGSERTNKDVKLQNYLTWRQTMQDPKGQEHLDMLIADLSGEDPELFRREIEPQGQMAQTGQQNLTGQPLPPEQNSPNTLTA